MEMAGVYKNEIPYLPRHFDFKDGKLWPNDRQGSASSLMPSAWPRRLSLPSAISRLSCCADLMVQ